MKRSIIFCILFALLFFSWTYGPITREAGALIVVTLKSPGDSTKVTTATPTFKWSALSNPPREIKKKFHFKLATDPNFTSIVYEDTTIDATLDSMIYGGPPLTEWQAYFWTMRVKVDSLTMGDTVITYWQEDFARRFAFFYTTANVFRIAADGSGDLPTIQEGIVWATKGDTVWVDTGTYYENLRFYKKGVLVTSSYLFDEVDEDTTTIKRTVIDGSRQTRGEDKGSVVYFSSGVDSTSALIGFTIRGGTGTEVGTGADARINGGGIFCDLGSSPTIAHNIITENQALDNGGGIFLNSAAPNILHNIITRNSTVNGAGGGIECRFSIKIKASTGAKQGDQGGDTKASLSTSESGSEMSEEEIKNALNPKDATDVISATTPVSTAKLTQNNPPVPVKTWFARRDTIIQRDKYLVGDTIFFDGSGSYDPDYPADSIRFFQWFRLRYYMCWQAPPTSFSRVGTDTSLVFPITESETGMLSFYLRVVDYNLASSFSDTIAFSVQYRPHANAGADRGVAPGDTAWLNGTASCDINPDDDLIYSWSQDSGTTVTIGNPDSAVAFFFAEDSTYLGAYVFKLKVTDGTEEDSATVHVTVSNAPIPICQDDPNPIYGDTLVGFSLKDTMTLDASASFDLDPGDSVRYYIWQRAVHTFFNEWGDTSYYVLDIRPRPDSTKAVQKFTLATPWGGLLKFRLRVRDRYGVLSQVYDSVSYSVQHPPIAVAGEDSVLRPGNRANLNGSALEINPDQRDSLKYHWMWLETPQGITVQLRPSNTARAPYFDAPRGISGRYRLQLQVDDRFELSRPDEIMVVANEPPIAVVQHVSGAFEGDTVLLDASLSYDPDSAAFQAHGSTDAGGLSFAWSVKPPLPPGAEEPVIVGADQPIAKFVPYGTGKYVFQVLVNDTISVRQAPVVGFNITFDTVRVDSTYAYPIIQGNLIAHNSSGSTGGGIDCNGSSPDIVNNIFYKNQSKSSGGAICGRAFSTPQIKNNIFFGNISSDSTGGAIADLKAQLSPSATRGFRKLLGIQTNCFWDNAGGALYQATGNISDNIYAFPRLIDPDFGDFRLECTSPCREDSIGLLLYFQPCYEAPDLGMVELALFQNPVATAVAHLTVNTDVPLKAPPVAYVKVGSKAPSPVHFTPISPKAFRGSHVFTSSGDAEISVFVSSLLERDTTIIKSFGVQLIGSGNGGTLASADRRIAVLFPEGSIKEDIYATCISVSDNSKYQFDQEPDVTAVGEPYQLGPSISFEKDLTVSFPLMDVDLKDKDKTLFVVCRYDNGKWNRLESFLDGNSVCAKAKSLGVFRLIYDPRGKHIAGIPQRYELYQNYPNPFNPQTQLRYDLPASGQVELSVYNVLGQRVRVLVDQMQEAGRKSVIWDGKDGSGHEVASGIYFYKIKAENYQKTMKMVLLK